MNGVSKKVVLGSRLAEPFGNRQTLVIVRLFVSEESVSRPTQLAENNWRRNTIFAVSKCMGCETPPEGTDGECDLSKGGADDLTLTDQAGGIGQMPDWGNTGSPLP